MFLKEPNESTIYEFQNMAKNELKSIWNNDSERLDEASRIYERNGVRVIVANCFTR